MLHLVKTQLGTTFRSLAIEYWEGKTIEELRTLSSRLKPENTILFSTMCKDHQNNFYIPRFALDRICEVSSVPIFGIAETYIGNGCIGGYVESSEKSGKEAAQLIYRLLKKEPVKHAHIFRNSGKYLFDQRALRKWNIDQKNIPENATVIQQPQGYLYKHPEILYGALFLFSALILSLGGLYFHNKRTKHLLQKISMQEKREAHLNSKYASVLSTTSEAVITADMHGCITLFNPGAEKIFGYTEEEALKLHLSELWPPGTEDEQEALRKRVLKEGEVSNYETIRMDATGRIVPVEMSIQKSLDDSGNAVGTSTILRDISERKTAEAEIQKFKQIFDEANYGCAIVKLDGTIDHINNYFSQCHGFTQEEVKGKNLSIFHSESQLELVESINRRIIKYGSYAPIEVGHAHKDGTEFPMIMAGIVIKDDTGAPLRIAATAVDISEQKKMEKEKSDLEKLFYQSQKLESVGRLAGGIAHDLNNLLAPVIGFCELLLEDIEEEEHRESLNEMLSAGFKARDLIQQLLAFSRRQTLQYKPVDISQTVKKFEETSQENHTGGYRY